MKYNFRLIVITVAVIATIIALFSSCMTLKKQEDNAYRFFRENNGKLAELCSNTFPVKDSIAPPIIIYKPALNKDYSGKIDSLNNKINALNSQINKPVISLEDCRERVNYYKRSFLDLKISFDKLKLDYQKCKPDTIDKTNNIYRKDGPEFAALNYKLVLEHDLRIKAEIERDVYKKKYKTWLSTALVTITLLGIAIFAWFKK